MALEPTPRNLPDTRPGDVQPIRWPWLSLLPLGLGAWAPIYAGVRAGRRAWWLLGVLWTLLTIAGWALAAAPGSSEPAGFLVLVGWIGAVATSFTIRSRYAQLESSGFRAALRSASARLAEREQGRRLALEQPSLARELGVGRPDLAGAQAAGLIDVNNAPLEALMQLPGVDRALAQRIVQARVETRGFSSIEDLGSALDLDGPLVESLREWTVFLPS